MAQIIGRGKNRWLVRIFLGRGEDGKPKFHNKTVHGNKKDAEQHARQAELDRDRGILTADAEDRTIGGLLDDLLLDYRVNGKDYNWCFLLVERQLRPSFGSLAISKLATAHVNKFTAKRLSEGKANATINNELALLRHALNLGAKSDPPKVLRVIRIPKLATNNVRKGFFERSDYLKLRFEFREDLRPVLTFAYYTGCRRGEILKLLWTQVDLIERLIRLEPGTTKNDEARIIPLTAEELYQTIAMQKSIRDAKYPDCPWVFFREGGKRIGEFKKAWWGASKRAGLWTGDEKTGRPTKLFHDLRRSGVRNLIRAGVPEKTAMRISGHKTRSVFDRYNIVDERDLKDAMRRVESYHRELSRQEETAAGIEPEKPASHTIVTQEPEPGKVN